MRKAGRLSRRDLIKAFGPLAFLLMPIARSMGYVAGGPFSGAPRFVMFFKGGSFHSPSVMSIPSITSLSGSPLEPLQPHAADIILFKGMHTHGGSPKTDGYKEEHGAGLLGCVTGNSYHYYENDSYMAYTDHESIDITIANHYQTLPALANLPFSSLHLGAGARSDCDSCGLGQRYISFRQRQAGDGYYGNAIEPIQNAGQVYDSLMQRVNLICSGASNQPGSDNDKTLAALYRKKSLVDFRLADIAEAKRTLGMDSEHARKLDGLVAGWRDVESATQSQIDALGSGVPPGSVPQCPAGSTRPGGNGEGMNDCDDLSPVHDQMVDLIQLAFAWDLTRVVAFTLSGASSGHRWSSRGIDRAHHSLEHGGDVAGLNVMGTYFSEKFARLLAALKRTDDGDGHTALYNSTIILGMECWSDGGHYLRDIPYILAGQGAGKFTTGRIVDAGGRNNNDLLISALNASGIQSEVYGLESLCQGPIV